MSDSEIDSDSELFGTHPTKSSKKSPRKSSKRKYVIKSEDPHEVEKKQIIKRGKDGTDRFLRGILKDSIGSDIKIIFTYFTGAKSDSGELIPQEKEYNLHKILLCRSDYFKTQNTGPWKESGLTMMTVTIDHEFITERSLDLFISLFYTMNPAYFINENCDDFDTRYQLYSLCDFYRMEEPMPFLIHSFRSNDINCDTLLAISTLAEDKQATKMMKFCVQWAKVNYFTKIKEELIQDLPEYIISPLIHSVDCLAFSGGQMWLFKKCKDIAQDQDQDQDQHRLNVELHYKKCEYCKLVERLANGNSKSVDMISAFEKCKRPHTLDFSQKEVILSPRILTKDRAEILYQNAFSNIFHSDSQDVKYRSVELTICITKKKDKAPEDITTNCNCYDINMILRGAVGNLPHGTNYCIRMVTQYTTVVMLGETLVSDNVANMATIIHQKEPRSFKISKGILCTGLYEHDPMDKKFFGVASKDTIEFQPFIVEELETLFFTIDIYRKECPFY